MESTLNNVIVSAKRHAPEVLNPRYIGYCMLDIMVRSAVHMMRQEGKSDDEISEAIDRLVNKMRERR